MLDQYLLAQLSDGHAHRLGLDVLARRGSALYLECMLDVAGERLACARFEQCVRALFQLTDEEPRRERVQRWMRTLPEIFTAITETPEETAGRFVRQVAEIGAKRATFGVCNQAENPVVYGGVECDT